MVKTPSQSNPLTQPRPRRQGYSLIELLVVISIITVLAGMVLGVWAAVKSGARTQEAQMKMTTLTGIADTYARQTGEHVPHHDSGLYKNTAWADYDADYNTDASGSGEVSDSIERFVYATYAYPDTAKMVPSVGTNMFVDEDNDGAGNGFYEFRDPWGMKLVYVKPNTNFTGDAANDGNNVLLTLSDGTKIYQYQLPKHPRPFFASAGPDGDFGNARDDPSGVAREDNIYSFDIEGGQHR